MKKNDVVTLKYPRDKFGYIGVVMSGVVSGYFYLETTFQVGSRTFLTHVDNVERIGIL